LNRNLNKIIQIKHDEYIEYIVEIPQLRRQALSGGICGSIFVILAMSTTVYSLKLETNMKWYMISPFRSVNLVLSCLGIQGDTLNGKLVQQLLLVDLQSIHSPQSGRKIGITVSPFATSVTSFPTLSTTLCHMEKHT
jgi:hypothetical protein